MQSQIKDIIVEAIKNYSLSHFYIGTSNVVNEYWAKQKESFNKFNNLLSEDEKKAKKTMSFQISKLLKELETKGALEVYRQNSRVVTLYKKTDQFNEILTKIKI